MHDQWWRAGCRLNCEREFEGQIYGLPSLKIMQTTNHVVSPEGIMTSEQFPSLVGPATSDMKVAQEEPDSRPGNLQAASLFCVSVRYGDKRGKYNSTSRREVVPPVDLAT